MANGGYIIVRSGGPKKTPFENPKRWQRSKQDRERVAKAMHDVYNQGLKMSKEEKLNRMAAMPTSPWFGGKK